MSAPHRVTASKLAAFIRSHRRRILDAWLREELRLAKPRALPREKLLDHFPHLLDRIAALAEAAGRGEPLVLPDESPDAHALTRLDQGFDLREVTSEYSLLRRCLLHLMTEGGEGGEDLVPNGLDVINEALDQAVAQSVTRFTRIRERTLEALDRISEAALDSTEVDVFLPRLLEVLMETTPAVDTVCVLLRDGDLLRMKAAVGLEEEVASGFTLRVGQGFAGRIAQERKPLMVRAASEDPLVVSPFLRAKKVRALYGVPLLHGPELVGVAHMGSLTAFDFSEEDKLIFRTTAHRATAFISQAQLAARERESRARAEEASRRLRFLAQASAILGSSLDYETTLATVARLAVPELADWCSVHILEGGDQLRPLAVAQADGESAQLAEAMQRQRLRVPEHSHVIQRVLETGQPELYPEAGLEIREGVSEERLALWRDVGLRSLMFLPLLAGERRLGTLTLMTAGSGRRYGEEDLATAAELARSCGRAIENAQLHSELDAQRRRSEAVLEQLPVGVLLADAETGRFTFSNHEYERIIGIRPGTRSPAEDPLPWAFHPDGRPYARSELPLSRALQQGQSVTGEELRIIRPDGESRFIIANAAPLRDEGGRVVAGVVTFVDITEQKQAQALQERILGIVGHDLRSPLSSITTSAALLLKGGTLAEREGKSVARIARSADRMARMIRDLLDFARTRGNARLPVARQPVNMRALCRQLIDDMEAAHPTRMVRLRADACDCDGEWDPDRVAQLLTNLVTNAVLYSPEDTPVDVLLRDDGDAVVLEVRNQGEPIPPELRSVLFRPFTRGGASEERASGGLGLGLYIVQQIALAHGGRVTVRSTREEGTVFTVRLPRRAPAEP
ncbi:MAG TPA: ATP-binding protein [Myxococcaceae bacterium]|nr:ATP-binding protein [Myxococcaceae bacterium]